MKSPLSYSVKSGNAENEGQYSRLKNSVSFAAALQFFGQTRKTAGFNRMWIFHEPPLSYRHENPVLLVMLAMNDEITTLLT